MQRGVANSSKSLQVDVLQLACVHPQATSLPGKIAVQFLRCCISAHTVRCYITSATECSRLLSAAQSPFRLMRCNWLMCIPRLPACQARLLYTFLDAIALHTMSAVVPLPNACSVVWPTAQNLFKLMRYSWLASFLRLPACQARSLCTLSVAVSTQKLNAPL